MKKLSIILLTSFFIHSATAQGTFLKKVNGEYKYGLKDMSGKEITEALYDEIGKFYDGIAKTKLREKFGLINASGKVLASPKYDAISELHIDMTTLDVMLNDKWGVIDLAGNELVVPKYNNPIEFEYSSLTFISIMDPAGKNVNDKLVGVINDSYKEVISPKYTKLEEIGSGYYKFSKDRINVKYGLLDWEGKEIFAMKYENLFANSKEIISIKRNNNWFLLDKKENAISNVAYENVFRVLEGRAKVKRAGKYGFIDEKGNEVISCKYEAAEYFKTSKGITYAPIQLDGRKYNIDINGNEIDISSGSNIKPKVETPTDLKLTTEDIDLFDQLAIAYATAEERKIVFEEKFSTNQNKWLEDETDRFSFKMMEDKYNKFYRMQSKKGGFWFSSIPIQFSASDDFNITAVVSKVSGTDDYYFGMLLGRNRNNGYYHFAGITGSGNCVFANKGPVPKDLILSTKNENVEKGERLNKIEINKKGKSFELLINGYLVAKTTYEEFYGNDFGFQLWSGDQNLAINVYRLTIKVTKAEQ